MEKDNNTFEMQKTTKFVEGAYFNIERGASIIIEENCELGNGRFRIIANGDYLNKHKIVIKKGTHIAYDTVIRNSDGECIIDPVTKEALSEPQDIIIGENCWITTRCTRLGSRSFAVPLIRVTSAKKKTLKRFAKRTVSGWMTMPFLCP